MSRFNHKHGINQSYQMTEYRHPSPTSMARFSLKLLVLIGATLASAAILHWSADIGNSYPNPQRPLVRERLVAEEKRDTHEDLPNKEAANYENLNPKITSQHQHKDKNFHNLQVTEGAQEDPLQRTENENPQLNEISGDIDDEQEKQDEAEDLQGNDKDNAQDKTAQDQGTRIKTFFTALPTSFAGLHLEDGNGIPTAAFLEACNDLTPFLDKFGRTSMTLARQDFQGNGKKIQAVYDVDPESSRTLQQMVLTEMDNGDYIIDGKGTISLLWLKRGFNFLAEFLHGLADGEEPNVASSAAYEKHLAMHHNFILRGTFRFGVSHLPSRTDVFKSLAVNEEDASLPNFNDIVTEDMAKYNKGLENILQIIHDFNEEHGLEN